ncbi:MAG TPA: site-specific tyrosine recombinase/integron integrase [Thermoplasmataceae archaeon]|nr:site-specific tyrosine recombinase/integron integrase [Thermoplasmataceae archaeon]
MKDPGEIERFISVMVGERKSPYTVKQYSFFARMFLSFMGGKLSSVTERDIERFKQFLAIEKGYSKASQYLAILAVKHFLKLLKYNMPDNLRPPRRSRHIPVYLSETEAAEMIKASADNGRDQAMVLLLATTGLRVGEMCRLRVQDVDISERIIFVKSGKGDKDRIVPMSQECSAVLSRYILHYRKANSGDYLFPGRDGSHIDSSSVERRIRKIAKAAGLKKKITPHVLRHTFATAVLKNGGDIRFIQQVLGHASISTTEIYTHIDSGMLKEMYDRHRPRYDLQNIDAAISRNKGSKKGSGKNREPISRSGGGPGT